MASKRGGRKKELYEKCLECIAAHPGCKKCCRKCDRQCNGAQACRL